MEHQYIYTKGFNDGHILAKYKPVLVTKLMQGLCKTSEYLQGLSDGKAEYEKGIIKHKMVELDQLRSFGEPDLNIGR